MKDTNEKQRITIFMDQELVRKFKIIAAARGTTMTAMLEHWVEAETK